MDGPGSGEFVIVGGAMCVLPIAAERVGVRGAPMKAAAWRRDAILQEFRRAGPLKAENRVGGELDVVRAEGESRERVEPAHRSTDTEGARGEGTGTTGAIPAVDGSVTAPEKRRTASTWTDHSEVLNNRRPAADIWLLLDMLLAPDKDERAAG